MSEYDISPLVSIEIHEYQVLANFRYTLRRFLRFSEDAAACKGLSPQQHQALLFTKAALQGPQVSVGDLAEWLQIKPHSAAELVGRLESQSLLQRFDDPNDRRRTLLRLSPQGEDLLSELTVAHRRELGRLKEPVRELLTMLEQNSCSKP